jgi:hypothetical protein|tara:strand:- start:425 stop:607 length:183 start_codon:yes stop_codon:yes gene_type:complete
MRDQDHTVSYTPIEYYAMGESSKRRIKEMQAQGIPTKFDPKENPEDVGKMESFAVMMIEK